MNEMGAVQNFSLFLTLLICHICLIYMGVCIFFLLAALHNLWDLSSLMRNQTWALSSESSEF